MIRRIKKRSTGAAKAVAVPGGTAAAAAGVRPDAEDPPRATSTGSPGAGLVEVLTALVILSAGLLAIAGLGLPVASQVRDAGSEAERTLAAQEALERLQADGFATAASGTDTARFGNRAYVVNRVVTPSAPSVKHVQVTVSPTPGTSSRTLASRIYDSKPLPGAP